MIHHFAPDLPMTQAAFRRSIVAASLALALAVSITRRAAAASFHEMPTGCAFDIAAGEGDYPWVIGCNGAGAGNAIYYWDGTEWIQTNGAGTRISVYYGQNAWGPDVNNVYEFNYPAVVNAYGEIYYGIPQGNDIGSSAGQVVDWTQIPGCGLDVVPSVGTTGGGYHYQPTAVAQNCAGAGETLYPEVESTWSPVTLSGITTLTESENTYVAPPIALGMSSYYDGAVQAWFVNSSGNVCVWNSTTCYPGVTSCSGVVTNYGNDAIAIGSSSSDPVWILDTNFVPEYLDPTTLAWVKVPGGPPFLRIDVGVNGNVWLVDFDSNIWYYN